MSEAEILDVIFWCIVSFGFLFFVYNFTKSSEEEYDKIDIKLNPLIETYDDSVFIRLFVTDIKIPINNIWNKYYEKELLFSGKVYNFLSYKFPFLSLTEIKEQFGELKIPVDFEVVYEEGVYKIDKNKLEEIGKFIKYVKSYIENGYIKCQELNEERKRIVFKD